MARWRFNRMRTLAALEQFVWDIKMPPELYEDVIREVLLLLLDAEDIKYKKRKPKAKHSKGNVLPLQEEAMSKRAGVMDENMPWPCGYEQLMDATEQFATAVDMPDTYYWAFVPQLLRLLYDLEPQYEPEPPP